MTTQGSIDPWNLNGERFSLPVWEDENHETPFSALAFFLEQWPGPVQTSEQPDDVRHNRLVETVAGYPEIFTGRRPLDAPLHPKSMLAFKLALFLDKIASNTSSEWHSLRTELLSVDLVSPNVPRKEWLHRLIAGIRDGSEFKGKDGTLQAYMDHLHSTETHFLTALHSRHHKRVEAYWPLKKIHDKNEDDSHNQIDFHSFDPQMKPPLINYNISGKKHWREHSFRFKSIQSWIKFWAGVESDKHPINPNVRHNLVIGGSVVLESIFAKMRSGIIRDKNVGSIVIDGGGRLSFLSKKTEEEEYSYFMERLGEVFQFDKHHPHPYGELIQTEMNKYSNYKVVKNFLEEHADTSDFFEPNDDDSSKNGGKTKLKKKGFEWIFRSDYIHHCLPKITTVDDESASADYHEQIMKTEEGRACILCQHSETGEYRDGPSDWLKETYICPLHYLLFKIGEAAQIRMGSRHEPNQKAPEMMRTGEKRVQQMVLFDGNSIGGWFTKPFDNYSAPVFTEKDDLHNLPQYNMPFWEENSEAIIEYWGKSDVKKLVLDPNEDLTKLDIKIENFNVAPDCWPDVKEEIKAVKVERFVIELMVRQRMQAILRRQRRSFQFNAIWWKCLRSSLNHLTPWILAGDDLLLVNNSRLMEEDILTSLKDFDYKLQEEFPSTTITFAGSLVTRGDNTINAMYKKGSKLEKEAGYLWKEFIAGNQDLPPLNDSKREKMEAWREENTDVQKHLKILIENIDLFTLCKARPIPSIILFEDWKNRISNLSAADEC